MRIMGMQGVSHRLLAIVAALGLAGGDAAADTTTSPADQSNYGRTLKFSYEADTGRLSETTVEPDRPTLCKKTTVAYDAWGNLTRSTESHCDDAPARVRVKPAMTQDKFDAVASQSFTVNGASVSMAIPAGVFATTNENALTHRATTGFDPRFGIPISIKDPNNVVSRIDLDDFGRTIRAVAPNGTSVVTYYCALPAAGVDTSANTTECPEVSSPERPDAAVSFTQVEARDTKDRKSGAFVRTYVDALGRAIRVATESFDGTQQPEGRSGAMVVSDTVFGPQGQKLLQTSAYFLASGSSTLAGSQDVSVSAFEYDDLGRVVLTASSNPNGQSQRTFGSGAFGYGSYGSRAAAQTIVSFTALTTKTTDPQGRVSQVELNGLRQISRVTDRGGAQLAYRYDAFGLVVETRDALQNLSSTTYDIVGRVVAVDDPDKGVSQLCLDVLGRPKFTQTSNQRGSHTAANCPDLDGSEITAPVQQKWTTYAYDVLGRKTQERSSGDVYTWNYDSGTGAVGRLSKSTTAQGVTKQYYYDAIGRAVSSRTDIVQGPSFASSVSYDSESGRLDTKTYPTGLKVGYVYTARGFLTALRTKSVLNLRPMPATPGGTRPDQGTLLSADSVLWSAQTLRADGGIEKAGFSSNVTATTVVDANGRMASLSVQAVDFSNLISRGYGWDDVDNLKTRVDNIGGGGGAVSESFEYDSRNRLKTYLVSSPAIPSLQRRVDLSYSALGMIQWKSDVGNYAYPAQGAGVRQPHAPTQLAGAQLGYDLNGNMLSSSAGKYQQLTYTDFDRVETAKARSSGISYAWFYDESQFRVKETRVSPEGARTLWYLHPDAVGGLGYEMETTATSTSHRHFLTVGGQAVGVIVSDAALPALSSQQTAPSSVGTLAINKLEYWHQDYQGSLIATTDHIGAVTARYAYDPFGQRRPTDGNVDAAGSLMIDWRPDVNAGTSRGYTGHEHRDDVGLINMNGRVFDGRAGVFLQADPVLQERLNTQNFGAYAYVFNNPLNATDPSGMVTCPPEGCVPLNPQKIGGKRGPLSEDRYQDDDRWLTPLPDWAPNGEVQRAKDQTQASKIQSFAPNCVAGSCLRLNDDPGKPGAVQPGVQQGQFSWSNSVARFWKQLNRSFGIFDRFKPSRESFLKDARRLMGSCRADCELNHIISEGTADVFEGATDGVIEYANGYYPDLAKEAAGGVLAEAAVRPVVLLLRARAARNLLAAELRAQQMGTRTPAAVTGGYNLRTGQVAACASGGRRCAEDHVFEALGGNKAEVRFTDALRPRQDVEQPICFSCENKYGRFSFPRDALFKSDQ